MAKTRKDAAGALFVVGLNHRSATAALRERLHVEAEETTRLLVELRAAELLEACVISTCDRLDIVGVHSDPSAVAAPLLDLLAKRGGIAPEAFRTQSYHHVEVAAVRHLFAVAASLDSQIVGEPQILGQVKESHRLAADGNMTGPLLEAALQAAYGAAKRVRQETKLAERPVSMAACGVQLARNLHGDLSRRSVLLIGLSEMGELMASEFRDAGLGALTVMHGSARRAESVAHRLGCHVQPWEELAESMARADIIVTAQGAGRYTVTAPLLEAALKQRRRQPIFLIDAAVPGDIDPQVGSLEEAFVYDLDDLEQVARRGQSARESAAQGAWRIVEQEVETFWRQRAERNAVPAVVALRRRFETERARVLANGKLDVEAATQLLINRLLHNPSEALRRAGADDPGSSARLTRAIERLFGIAASAHGHEAPEEEDER